VTVSSDGARRRLEGRRRAPFRCVVPSPGGPGALGRPGLYLPVIIIVIVVALTVISPPGQIEAVLYALLPVLSVLGFREEPA
jgi:hypothetical protein